jgi:hypothetical protein
MAHNYLNPVISSVAVSDGAASTYHPLSGQAQQILLSSTASANPFYFTFDTTSDIAAVTSGAQFVPGNYAVLMNVNKPAYINVFGAATGYISIMEFV